MRPEVWQVVTNTAPVVLVTGDTGTGKSSVLQSTLAEYANTVVAPPVSVCLFDSGALQVALFDALATVLAIAGPGEAKWRDLAKRFRHATREAAIEIGKALADAVVEEVVEFAKTKLGENAGKGLLKFWTSLKKDTSPDLRRTLRSQSDANVVRLLMQMSDEVASVVGRDLVITLDEGNRLSEDDQRVLGSIAAMAARRVRIVIAWSTAEIDSLPGLMRLRKLGVSEIEVAGLSRDDVERWLATVGMTQMTNDIHSLTAGYPLLVEGLVAYLRGGGSLDRYSAPTLFNDVLADALTRLPTDAHHAARRLSGFSYPLPEDEIPGYLGVDAVAWGAMRNALERERVFSVPYAGGTWFHESRRAYLWSVVLTKPEREQVGQSAYSRLLEHQRRADATYSAGVFRQISVLAPYARDSLAASPTLGSVLGLNVDQLGVLAAVIELTDVENGSSTPADQIVIHAHTAYGVDRAEAINALPALQSLSIVSLKEISSDQPGTTESVTDLLLDYESDIVARGRIQSELGKAAVPHLANHVVRVHLERVRLESYRIITQAGFADAMQVIDHANLVRAPAAFRRIGDPVLGIWLRYGDQPVTVVGIFNTTADRAAAEREIADLSGVSFGRRVVVDRTFKDPTHTIASLRFMRAVYFATGLSLYSDHSEYWLDHPPPLPMLEFAQRQVDLLSLLRSETDQLEREVYDLTQLSGVAIARQGKTEYRLDVRGAAHVYPMDFDKTADIVAKKSLVSARMELALGLTSAVSTKHLTTQTWQKERTQDPVVELLGTLRKRAEKFNARQPRTVVRLEKRSLQAQLAAAHIRDQHLARRISETITIGGERGIRPMRALRLAIFTRGSQDRPTQRTAVCAWPLGDPSDVEIQYLSDAPFDTAESAYKAVFGADADMTDLHGGMLPAMLASLLGFGDKEIEIED